VKATPADYYTLLGVEPDATLAQIKRAYRKLARLHHPDTNPGDPQAAARFRQITEAYDTLSDPGRRQAYDQTRPKTAGTKITDPGRDTQAASAWSTSWKTSGRPSGTGTRRSRPWSSSWPAAPKPASPAGDTSRRAAGTSTTTSAPKS
jgi:curved DNA-binding protein CbpA